MNKIKIKLFVILTGFRNFTVYFSFFIRDIPFIDFLNH